VVVAQQRPSSIDPRAQLKRHEVLDRVDPTAAQCCGEQADDAALGRLCGGVTATEL